MNKFIALFIILLASFCQGGGLINFDKMTDIEFQQMSLAEQGNAVAQNYVGVMYYNGGAVSKDEAEAAKWFLKAAVQGNEVAQNNLKAMAGAGNANAQAYVGWTYQAGKGTVEDTGEAAKWYRKAAEQGHADARRRLALMNEGKADELIQCPPEPMRMESPVPAAQASTLVDPFVSDPAPADKPQNSGTVALSIKPNSPALVDPLVTTAAISAQPLAHATVTYRYVLMAACWAYVLALVIAFLTSKQSSGLLQSKPIKGGLSFFCGVLICLGPIFSLGQLEIDRQKIASSIPPEMLTTLALEAIGITAFMIYGVFVGVKIWKRSPRGVQLARRYLLARLIALPAITICALMFMPPLPNKVLEAFGGGFMVAIREMIIVGAWWLYFAKSKNVKETYAITQASPPPLPGKEEKAGMVAAVYGINQNRKKERNMSENKKFIIVAVIVFILPAIYCFKEAAFHEHTSSCVISSHQNREGEMSGGNDHPSKSDCVSHFIWVGGVLAFLGVGTIVNIVRKQD